MLSYSLFEDRREWWLDKVDRGQKPIGVFMLHGTLSCVSVVLDSLDTPRLEMRKLSIDDAIAVALWIFATSFDKNQKVNNKFNLKLTAWFMPHSLLTARYFYQNAPEILCFSRPPLRAPESFCK